MCIRVQYVPRQELDDPWDPGRLVITLPSELNQHFALRVLRAVLDELDVEQPEFGARCWCGDSIGLLPAIPQQRRSGQVMTHGA